MHVLVLAIVASTLLQVAPSPATPGAVRALRVAYADGRTTVTPITERGVVSWTPAFPRVPGARTATEDGLPLNALQFEEAPDGDALRVTLALLYGSPHQRRVPVTTVRVTAEAPVRVDALQAFGVQPITMSIVTLPPAQLHLPSVTSPSSDLAFDVEVVEGAVPAYHVTISNYTARAVMMLQFKAYRGRMIAIQGSPRGTGSVPLIDPKTRYVLKIRATPNQGRGPEGQAWLPLDRIEITTVMWSDGLVEGDAKVADGERVLDAGTAQQLDRLLTLLRDVARDPSGRQIAALKELVTAMPIWVTSEEAASAHESLGAQTQFTAPQVQMMMQTGMRNARTAVLNDIDEFIRDMPGAQVAVYARWLDGVVAKFEGWRARIRAGSVR